MGKKRSASELQAQELKRSAGHTIEKMTALTYEQKVANAVITAKPMASEKLAKKCYKLIKKAAKHKNYLRKAFKDVQKELRKGGKGIVVFAGDIAPLDLMIHLPAVCEQNDVPYCYVPCRADLGTAAGIIRGCSAVLVKEKEDYKEKFDELHEELKHFPVEL